MPAEENQEEDLTPDAEPEVVARSLPKRSTRGRRMTKLVDEEESADNLFWNQAAFQDEAEEEDNDYAFKDQKDIVDSDIDLSEDDQPDESTEIVREKRKRSTRAYREPTIKATAQRKSSKRKKHATRVVTANPRSEAVGLRSSTKTKSEVARKIREADAAIQAQAEKRRAAAGRSIPPPRLSQEDMLLEALETAQENKLSLRRLLSVEASKKQNRAPRSGYLGPIVRFHSRKSNPRVHTLTFTDVDHFPPAINQQHCKYRKRPTKCAITGLPAKYRDPQTGLPYANLTAFRELRRRHDRMQNEDQNSISEEENLRSAVTAAAKFPSGAW